MANQYLEKIALLNHLSSGLAGYAGAKKGDKAGGVVTSLVTGEVGSTLGVSLAHGLLGNRRAIAPLVAADIGGRIAGAYAGGALYSKAKKALGHSDKK